MKTLTTQQLADRWNRTTQWIAAQAAQGVIPGAMKIGHYWRFDLSDIEAHEEAQKSAGEFELAARRRAA